MENENNIKLKVGARIKFLRNEIGLTQEQLANKLTNVKGKSSIANYENGSNLPSDEVKLKMCEIFNCSLDYLMCKSDIRNPEEVDENKLNVAFSSGFDGLNDTNKNIINNIISTLKDQQDKESENKKENEKK